MAFRFQLAEAFVKITMDDKDFLTRLAAHRKRLASMGGAFRLGGGGNLGGGMNFSRFAMGGSLGSKLAGAIGGGGILGLIAASGKAASAAQEMEQRFKQVFRDLSGEAEAFATNFSESLNRSVHSVMDTMANFQLEFTAQGMGLGEAMAMSQGLVRLTADLAAFHNMSDSDVGSRVFRALVGNHRALYELGIVMNQAALEQAALNEGYKQGFKDLAPLEKMQVRYAYIMRASADANGQAKREMGNLASQWKQMQDGVHELAIEIGTSLTPALLGAVQHAKDLVAAVRELHSQGSSTPTRSGQNQGESETGAKLGMGSLLVDAWGAMLGWAVEGNVDNKNIFEMFQQMQMDRIPQVHGVSQAQLAAQREARDKRNSEAAAAKAGGPFWDKLGRFGAPLEKLGEVLGNQASNWAKNTMGVRDQATTAVFNGATPEWVAKILGAQKKEQKEVMKSSFMDPISYVREIQRSMNDKALNVEEKQLEELQGLATISRGIKDAMLKLGGVTIQPDFGF